MSTEPFDDLFMPHFEVMRRFVRRRMRTQDDVDDAVQRTLLLAFVPAIQRELDGLSVAQAAAATATSIAAAKSARFRARQRLAIAMRNQCLVRAVGNSR